MDKHLGFVEALYKYAQEVPMQAVTRLIHREIQTRDRAAHVVAAILLFQDHFKTFYHSFLRDPQKNWKYERRRMYADVNGYAEALEMAHEALKDDRTHPARLVELQFMGYIIETPPAEYRLGDERRPRTTVNAMNFKVQNAKRRQRAAKKIRDALNNTATPVPKKSKSTKRVQWAQ